MDREGWIEIGHDIHYGIFDKRRICSGCKHLKREILVSGRNPRYYYRCAEINKYPQKIGKSSIIDSLEEYREYIISPGENGEKCPFHLKCLRNLKINDILDE